jgi:hypothetical protein
LVGVATNLIESPRGLHGSFRIARIPEGDQVLSMASDGVLDGFSIEVDFDPEQGDEYGPDPSDPSVSLVRRGTLTGVAMTGRPSFDDARVDSVAASRDNRLELRLDDAEAEGVRLAALDAGVSMSELVRGRLRHYTSQRRSTRWMRPVRPRRWYATRGMRRTRTWGRDGRQGGHYERHGP